MVIYTNKLRDEANKLQDESNILQKGYEKEYLEFIIQKINHAGGSLHFQHLSGLLQQLSFEIRDAFGVTKPALMKFLKAHASTFNVNSKGIVTVIDSPTLDDSANEEGCLSINAKKTFLPKIKNGKGFILKIFPFYAIIKSRNPVNSYIFFTPKEYGGEKDSLFTDFNLYVRNEVCLNAIHGHSDYEIEYRATEVWRSSDSDEENPHPGDLSMNKITKTKTFTGEGVVKKLLPHVGFISVFGKGSKDIFFYRSNVKDPSIKQKDRVEFVAECISNEWQATEIIKKRKENTNQPSEPTQTCSRSTDKQDATEEKLTSEPGKIYPYSKGAVIKFGKKYSELADCNVCRFYLYGFEVAIPDLAVEFSEGDDVKFDAIKLKDSPGWKAVLVWVGDKPANAVSDWKSVVQNRGNTEVQINANLKETDSDISSEISDLISRRKKDKNKEINTVNRGQKLNNKSRVPNDSPVSISSNSLPEEHSKNNNLASKVVSKRLSHKDFQYNQNKGRNRSRNRRPRNNCNPQKPLPKRSENSNYEKINKKLPICQDTDLDILESSESVSEENNELQDSPLFTRKYLVENKEKMMDASEFQENLTNETYSGNVSDEEMPENTETFSERASIKKFEAIDGEITRLFCKFAIVKSNHLRKDVDFILNDLYLNGKSAEEQQVIDLKEVIKVGDIIKLNCFEIIDDFGEIHQKVTIAWKGPKPDVIEIKPEEFILEQELYVSINTEQDCEYESEESFDTAKTTNLEGSRELNSDAESTLNDNFDDSSYQYSMMSRNKTNATNEPLSNVQSEKLSDRIFKKLETYGITYSEPEVVLNAAQEIIELVLKYSNKEQSSSMSPSQDSTTKRDSVNVCSYCGNTSNRSIQEAVNTAEAEVQTLITGEIFPLRE